MNTERVVARRQKEENDERMLRQLVCFISVVLLLDISFSTHAPTLFGLRGVFGTIHNQV